MSVLLDTTRANKQLEVIEYSKRTWRSKFIREHEIWEEIAMNINSTDGKERDYWGLVMDLYHDKYRND